MLPILALAGYEEIHEGAAGVGAYPATGGELAPYAAGFCRPGTYRWPNGTCRPYRPSADAFRGYVSGPKSSLSGNWMGVDDCTGFDDKSSPSYLSCIENQAQGDRRNSKIIFAGLIAMTAIAGVIYFTRGHSDSEPSGWDKAFTPNHSRRHRRRGKRRGARKSVSYFKKHMPTPGDLGGMSDGDADYLRSYWTKKSPSFRKQYKRRGRR